MSKDEKYFQFPLLVLAMNHPWAQLCEIMIGYTRIKYMEENECTYDETGTALNVTGGSEPASRRLFNEAENFVCKLPDLPATKATVRIKTTIVFHSRDGTGLDERQLRVLLAIYSAIGSNPMRRVTLDEIRRRAVGCASGAMLTAMKAIKVPKYCRELLTDKQLRRTVDDLHDGGHFARATYRNRLTYYSHRLQLEDLWKLIEKQKMPMLQRQAQRRSDAERSRAMLKRAEDIARLAAKGQTLVTEGTT